MTSPDFDSFKTAFESGKSQLIWSWIVADTETPISAYLKLCDNQSYSFLFESVEGGNVLGRYTILGFDPDLIWSYKDKRVSIEQNGKNEVLDEPALASLRRQIENCRIDLEGTDNLPPMAASGLFGFIGYDMIREIEKIPDANPDSIHMPDSVFIRPRILTIFDNVMHKICIACPVYEHAINSNKTSKQAYELYSERVKTVKERLFGALPTHSLQKVADKLSFQPNMTQDGFFGMVARARDYILSGDIFQVVLSQRFSCEFPLTSLDFYRSLRRINPSPFLFLLSFNDFSLIGSSPEILVRVRNGEVTIRPIAGTRARGKNPQMDQELAQDLLSDPKELSEHLMLLDLGRNDVGRVSETGSVKVTEKFTIEYYSHVMHIVSNVIGKLRSGIDSLAALMAGFPAGTVSGAPKIRAMEIIDELEPDKRKFYGGCIGYLSGNGNVDTCIALRTALIKNGKLYIQSGAGIVADSDPQSEYMETVNKAKALVAAAEDAVEQAFLRQSGANGGLA